MNRFKPIVKFYLADALRNYHLAARLGMNNSQAIRLIASREAFQAFEASGLSLLPSNAIPKLNHVVDVGANVGAWSSTLLNIASSVKLLAFEPNPACYTQLVNSLAQFPTAITKNIALGAKSGSLSLNVTRSADCGSILKPEANMKDYYGSAFELSQTVTVPVDCLDAFCAVLPEISLLKIDVQGYEHEVFDGAELTLKKTKRLLVEANFVSHYEGGSTFFDIHQRLTTAGFVLYNLSKPFQQAGRALWADALYLSQAESDLMRQTSGH